MFKRSIKFEKIIMWLSQYLQHNTEEMLNWEKIELDLK